MAKVPFPPFLDRPVPARYGVNSDRGPTERTGATVWHRMIGTLWGTDAYFRDPATRALTHWGIGGLLDGADDGRIIRWLRIGEPVIPYASGPWKPPGYGDGMEFVVKYGVGGINAKAESIEFSGKAMTPMTPRQWKAGIWLTAAIQHAGGWMSDEWAYHMHHREFTTPAVKDCPFPAIYQHTAAYYEAIGLLMRAFEDEEPIERNPTIGGVIVDLQSIVEVAGWGIESEPEPAKVIFEPFAEPRTFTVGPGGATVRQYGNRLAEIYAHWRPGHVFPAMGYYHGEAVAGDDRWLVETELIDPEEPEMRLHGRVHVSGVKEAI